MPLKSTQLKSSNVSKAQATQPRTCVVISHYNARRVDDLVTLLDQMTWFNAGIDFHVRVVVNAGENKLLVLPERHQQIEVMYRPNLGYNIGAWDHGWQVGRVFEHYLFLQEECRLHKHGWLRAFVAKTSQPEVGLVGESMVWERPWSELEVTLRRPLNAQFQVDGRVVNHFECYYENLRRLGIDRGPDGRHLQSLVYAARREVLERVGPFPLGADYGAAVTTEIGISKRVMALGLWVGQVGWLPFSYVSHPQWRSPLWRRILSRTVIRWLPSPIRQSMVLASRRLKKSGPD